MGLHHRLATHGDRAMLASFACSSLDPRLESWLRNDALDRQHAAPPTDDFRLLVLHQDDGQLVAITAHERNYVVAGPDGEPAPGTYFIVVAIADRFRDGRAPDGRPLVAAVLDATFADIRGCNRGEWVAMMVREGNTDGAAVVTRLGATHVGRSGVDDVYVVVLEDA